MRELEYPFDAKKIIENKKRIKRDLLSDSTKSFLDKRIAILGGSTTKNIRIILELFLLNYGIMPYFYESEYNQYYEEGMFSNSALESFKPDIIYICTSVRNIMEFPVLTDSIEAVNEKTAAICDQYKGLWLHISDTYHCPIIQNNFEYPFFRLLGNKDSSDVHGRVNFVTRINMFFYEFAQEHDNFYICDINYLASAYGLDKWAEPYYWYMYKYAVAVPAIPYLAYNIANIIKSLYGKNKKVINIDLDNTLWGGIIGDDGVNNIEVGKDTSRAQAYSEFQEYIKLHKQLGVLLSVNSKNEEENAVAGLERPDSVLRKEDFVSIRANWNPKSQNLLETAKEINVLPDSFVFVDDNPAERAIVSDQLEGVAVPEIEGVEHYIQILDKSGFFETTALSGDDLKRTEMYQSNKKRYQMQLSFANYKEYLLSLDMRAEIRKFIPEYMSRIAQLTNKSNQFNLTTKRYSQSEIEAVSANPEYITLYGRLKDKFGDNGVVSVVIGRIDGNKRDELHIELWIMSCRVLKRDMEYAMMDELVMESKRCGIRQLVGYYYKTVKNAMVKDFYGQQGFTKVSEDDDGNAKWKFCIPDSYQQKQRVIIVNP